MVQCSVKLLRSRRTYLYIPAVMATCVLCNARLWVGVGGF